MIYFQIVRNIKMCLNVNLWHKYSLFETTYWRKSVNWLIKNTSFI